MNESVYYLELFLKNDQEDSGKLKAHVLPKMKCWCRPAFHAKRCVGFVIVTPETIEHLHDRLLPLLVELLDLGRIERFVLIPAPTMVITDHGKMDPLAHYLRLGHVEAAQRNQSQRLRNRQRR